MATYYNDNDPFVCAWLRNLIADWCRTVRWMSDPFKRCKRKMSETSSSATSSAAYLGWAYALQLADWGAWKPDLAQFARQLELFTERAGAVA